MPGARPGRVPQTTAPNAYLARDAIRKIAAQIAKALDGKLIRRRLKAAARRPASRLRVKVGAGA